MTTAEPLFLLGLGRSGTTALGSLLSAHPSIVLGIERFKLLGRRDRIHEMSPALFSRERFFDFDDGLTNLTPQAGATWRAHYDEMAAKFDHARYVGDKQTHTRVQALLEAVPGARVVAIVREVSEVAASWDARAKNPRDPNWPEAQDAQAAVRRWNRSNQQLLRALRRDPAQVTVVEHASFFGDPEGGRWAELLDWLGLEGTAETGAGFRSAHARFAQVRDKERALAAEDADYVREHADLEVWGRLLRQARGLPVDGR